RKIIYLAQSLAGKILSPWDLAMVRSLRSGQRHGFAVTQNARKLKSGARSDVTLKIHSLWISGYLLINPVFHHKGTETPRRPNQEIDFLGDSVPPW
ncbi:MAG: hypothetical protein WA477_15840, partial [Candidatus Sulfotelmatobacter sp.]